MGNASYSVLNRSANTQQYKSQSREQIFKQSGISDEMSPRGVVMREARDSEENPNSFPIILGLDVTASMGIIPETLIKDGLPTLMGSIIEHGTPDPALLFMGIGDDRVDQAPLQIGQFESGDELLDSWLEKLWLESGGGGNGGESYHLAWYFAAYHTVTDAWEKRTQKGVLVTVGDEPVHRSITHGSMQTIMGGASKLEATVGVHELLSAAREGWEVYHIIPSLTYNGNLPEVQEGWKELLGERAILVDDHHKIPNKITEIVVKHSSGKDVTTTESKQEPKITL